MSVRALPLSPTPDLLDLRFPTLVGPAAWTCLPAAVRERFSRRLAPGDAVTYVGEITEGRRTRIGWLLAQACRVIGAPLPLDDVPGAPAVVTVTEDAAGGGQFWTRMYGRPRGFPQVIQSSKRFAGPTGLEEYLGGGFGIALTVRADAQGLHFSSDHYFLRLGGARLRLPRWLAPDALVISHIDLEDGAFAFVLTLRHPLAGEILRQTGRFRERQGAGARALQPDPASFDTVAPLPTQDDVEGGLQRSTSC